MPTAIRVVLFLGVTLAAVAAGLFVYAISRRAPAESDGALADLRIPPFSLTAQDGRPVSRDDLVGGVTVMDFVFTNCPFICPTMTEQLARLSERLRGTPVRFLSVSVDPDRDTPERLREFAAMHGADLSRWTFATGDKATVNAVVADGLKFALYEDASTQVNVAGGGTMANIVHPGWFVLVGPAAEVRGIYKFDVPDDVARLEADARRLAAKL